MIRSFAVLALCAAASAHAHDILGNFVLIHHAEALPGPTTFIVTADIDRDGKPDVLAAGNDFIYFRGKGDGTFYPAVTTQPAPGIGSWAASGDFDGDGRFDLVGQSYVYLGNGDGTFRSVPNSTPLGSIVSSFRQINLGANQINAVVADFDEDGKSDVAGADSSAYQVLLSNGDGSFRVGSSVPGVSQYTAAFTADMNRDGHADLILQASRGLDAAVFEIFLGDGHGSFAPARTVRFGFNALYTLLADLNSDAIPDFKIVSGRGGSFVALGNSDGSFREPVRQLYGGDDTKAVGDYNLDGFQDLLERFGSVFYISLGRGDGSFAAPMQLSLFGLVIQGDWNGDGRPDFAIDSGDRLNILLNEAGAGDLPYVQSSADGSRRVAPGSLASIFGAGFLAKTAGAPAPTLTLADRQLRVTDAAGATSLAELLYISPNQINFRIPPEVRVGRATLQLLDITDPTETLVGVGQAEISASAPTVFTCGPGTNALIATAEADSGRPEPINVCGNVRFSFPAQITFYGTGFVDATNENTRVLVADQRVSPKPQPVKPTHVGPAGGVSGLDKVVFRVEVPPTEDGDSYWSWISITVNGVVVGEGYTPVY
jgi:uncharacterized protein (TIGR03437 family)